MQNTYKVPYGYCYCGCGRKTNIAKQDSIEHEHTKGEPYYFCKGHRSYSTQEERFWFKVNKTKSCWLWTATKARGYGTIKIGGKTVLAHRYSWELHNGPIPDGLFVLHKCDVRNCIKISHLFLGTQAENIADRDRKGRMVSSHGEKNGNAKLTESTVREVFKDSKNGMLQKDIAKKHEISQQHVSRILNGMRWATLQK